MKQKLFNIGMILSYLTGILITLNNVIYFFRYIRGSLTDVFSSSVGGLEFLGPALFMIPFLGFWIGVNVIAMTYFGLKNKVKWTWFSFLLLILVVPIPTLIAQVVFNLTPYAFYSLILGIAAVAFTGPHVFSDEKN